MRVRLRHSMEQDLLTHKPLFAHSRLTFVSSHTFSIYSDTPSSSSGARYHSVTTLCV